jgi:hypothetical protein
LSVDASELGTTTPPSTQNKTRNYYVPILDTMKLATTLLIFTLIQTASSFTVSSWQRTSSSLAQSSDSRLKPLASSLRDDDDLELARISRRRRRYNDEDEKVYEQLDGIFDDDDDEDEDWDDDEDDDDEEYGLFSNVLIDNPLLDSIDPDGAAERFPELASDPRFWLDMVLFISFLNYLSAVGPQDYLPDLPWY